MNTNDPAHRSRGPPAASSASFSQRAAQDVRNGLSPEINIVSATGVSRNAGTVMSPGTLMSRAEKFEDEKRRIIESCFGKRETDGSISESYITHIRILEDAAHPSAPPPAQSPPENKKPRVIVVAVRKSGRVRMHKARENANGTFSIGKTWVLDDLTLIQSYTNAIPSNPEEQQNKERAGATGFIVTIQKPYYWQASTPKEKDFFIFSLIKIYKKYTGGKLPELHGFDPQELERLAGASGLQPGAKPKTPQGPSGNSENRAFVQGSSSSQRTRPPMPQQRDGSREHTSDIRPRPSPERSSRERVSHARPTQQRSSQEQVLRTKNSMPYIPGQFPSSEFVRNLNPQLSPPQVTSKRSDSPPPSLRPGSSDTWQASQLNRERRPSIGGSRISSSRKTSETRFDSDKSHPNAAEPPNNNSRDASILGNRIDQSDQFEGTFMQSADERRNNDISPSLATSKTDQSSTAPTTGETSPESVIKPDPVTASLSTSSPAVADISTETTSEADAHRPGLGPMIKKKSNKDMAKTFRKAATAYNAFKPRAGGAAEKILSENEKSPSENDGVSGVFPAPSILNTTSQSSGKVPTSDNSTDVRAVAPEPQIEIPTVSIDTSRAITVEPVDSETVAPQKASDISNNAIEERRKKRRSDHSSKYARVLDINHSLLEGRTFEIESVLNDFGWGEDSSERSTFEELQSGLRKEIGRVEAGTWLGTLENNDERVTAVGNMMDRVIAECEELDCLLTLYNVELGTLSEDVAYIEAQSQGLQVQTANQKLLHTELKNLLDTISISASDLKALKDASLSKPHGLQTVETTLSQLYTAMLTIDPRLRQNGTRPNTSDNSSIERASMTGGGSELSSMQAVREKKDGYRRQSVDFIQRLRQYMSVKFREVEAQTIDILEHRKNENLSKNLTRLDHRLREKPKADLWLYSPLLLFTREVEPLEWENLMRMYESSVKRPYQDEFKDNVFAWKCLTKKPSGEEDVLFTTQEKETESLVGRKLTVKRSKTVRSDGSSRASTGEKPKDGKVNAYEAFAGTLSEMTRMILVEQNFLVELFHITSLETFDFPDAVAIPSEIRKGGDPIDKKISDPDRNMAKRVLSMMEEIYSFWPSELQGLVDWVIKQEALQGVGVLLSLESQLSELEDTNQEFLIQIMSKVHDRVATLFGRFLEEQIRAIEDTKVKIKKRKGVITFIKTFPNFSLTVENMLPPLRNLPDPAIRSMVNDAYQKINKAMFESLKFIAKESPTGSGAQTQNQSASTGAGDPEDKEVLNYHILLIENMNHYIEEVTPRGNPVLEEWKSRATLEMEQHMHLYISAIVRRPLGKLLDFLESTESLLVNATSPTTTIAARASHSRSTFRKLLAQYDGREIRRGIETLKKRVEKHFGDADEAELSRGLVGKVLRACEVVYLGLGERVDRLVGEVYEGGLEVEWRREDVMGGFRR